MQIYTLSKQHFGPVWGPLHVGRAASYACLGRAPVRRRRFCPIASDYQIRSSDQKTSKMCELLKCTLLADVSSKPWRLRDACDIRPKAFALRQDAFQTLRSCITWKQYVPRVLAAVPDFQAGPYMSLYYRKLILHQCNAQRQALLLSVSLDSLPATTFYRQHSIDQLAHQQY